MTATAASLTTLVTPVSYPDLPARAPNVEQDRRITLLARESNLTEMANGLATTSVVPAVGLAADAFARVGALPGVDSATQLFGTGPGELALVTAGLLLVAAGCAGAAACIKLSLQRS